MSSPETTAYDEHTIHYEGWRVVGASSVGVFVSFASLLVYTFGVLLKPLADEFGWSREAVSAAFGFAAMTVAVCSPPLGYLLDRVSPRRIIIPCLTVFGCAFASLAFLTPHLWHLYATFVVLGVVGNGTAQMAYSRAVSSWFDRRRGTALAVVMSGGAVGAMVLPPIAEALIQSVGWRNACLILGGMVLVIGVPVVAGFIRERPSTRGGAPVELTGLSVRDGLTSRVFWILIAVLFSQSIAHNAALTHMPALLTDRGIPGRGAALALSAMGAASLCGRLLTGGLLDRFFAPRVAFCLLSIASFGAFLLAGAQSFAIGLLAAALIGMGMGVEAAATPYILTRYFGLRSFAMLYGFTWTAYAIAGAIGPVAAGRAFDLTGSYQALLTQLALGTFLVAALLLLMPAYTKASGFRPQAPGLSKASDLAQP